MPQLAATGKNIQKAAEMIRAGQLVAFSTETVYGLGADATNPHAIAKVFARKKRPQFNPLICHVSTINMAVQYGTFNSLAYKLADIFWPGPLTLVVPRRARTIPDLACAGRETIALRVPQHKIAQTLLVEAALPIVAPSANLSGRLSPTRAEHVITMFPELPVLDGGVCKHGIESTIIGCIDGQPLALRAGAIEWDTIQTKINVPLVQVNDNSDAATLTPGRRYRHYAPTAQLRLNAESVQNDEALLGFGTMLSHNGDALNLSESRDLNEAAVNLFAHLHTLDAHAKIIAVMPVPEHGLGIAINDRLRRAAQG